MKEKPINFSAEMARAVREGRKTQTMRVMKPQPTGLPTGAYCDPYNGDYSAFTFWTSENKMLNGQTGSVKETCHWKSPYQPGDRLWVREPWAAVRFLTDPETGHVDEVCGSHDIPPDSENNFWTPVYKADPCHEESIEDRGFVFRPSVHMPRWASRITLEVDEVSVMRVQDITEEQAKAEGVIYPWPNAPFKEAPLRDKSLTIHQIGFAALWDSICGPGAWDRNDWCWKIKFRRIHEND